ncbi:MAG TPA: hypothetical protein VIR01_21860 [Pyrinomonadaceae bacterium]
MKVTTQMVLTAVKAALLLTSCNTRMGSSNGPTPLLTKRVEDSDRPGLISMVQLLGQPEKYNGRKVQVIGFVHFEFEGNAIYLSREDYEYGIVTNGLWLTLSASAQTKEINNSYAVVEGTFNATMKGHFSAWSGSIENITLLKRWARLEASTAGTSFDDQWWKSSQREEQLGFINGYLNCYDVDKNLRFEATDEEFRHAIDNDLTAAPTNVELTVPNIVDRVFSSFKSKIPRVEGGEVWSEPHGYYDGTWWKQSSVVQQVGYLEGYLQCIERDKKGAPKFPGNLGFYQRSINQFFENPQHEDVKIANVLSRVRDFSDGR